MADHGPPLFRLRGRGRALLHQRDDLAHVRRHRGRPGRRLLRCRRAPDALHHQFRRPLRRLAGRRPRRRGRDRHLHHLDGLQRIHRDPPAFGRLDLHGPRRRRHFLVSRLHLWLKRERRPLVGSVAGDTLQRPGAGARRLCRDGQKAVYLPAEPSGCDGEPPQDLQFSDNGSDDLLLHPRHPRRPPGCRPPRGRPRELQALSQLKRKL